MSRRVRSYLVIAAAFSVFGGLGLVSMSHVPPGVAAPHGQPLANVHASAVDRSGSTRALVRHLTQQGFQVSPGYPLLYAEDPIERCRDYTYPALKNCFGANPAAPYVVAVVRSWPNEYVEQSTVNAFGPLRRGYSVAYRLHPREAIVLYGKMPPPGRYIGLQTYAWSKPGRWSAKDYDTWAHDPKRPWPMPYVFSTMPPDSSPRRVWSFSALGDIVNNVVMQRQSGYPFGKTRYFIITPSATTDRAVRRVLHARGVPDAHIFTEQIPRRDSHGAIGPLGMGKNAIDFVTTLRYAVPTSQDAANAWRSRLPLEVLRVRAPASVGPVKRYGALSYEPHTAHSEAYLAGDLRDLLKAVCKRISSTSRLHSADCARTPPTSYVVPELYDELGWRGPYCREIGMNCNGDNNDAAIYWGKPLPLDDGQVYAVVDTLATETGNATYVGLSINDASTFSSPANVLDTGLKGSADGFGPTVKNTAKMFVHYYARNCAPLEEVLGDRPQDCTRITDEIVPQRTDAGAVGHPALRGRLMVALRDYVVPGTERGADPSKLLPPRILTFTER